MEEEEREDDNDERIGAKGEEILGWERVLESCRDGGLMRAFLYGRASVRRLEGNTSMGAFNIYLDLSKLCGIRRNLGRRIG